MKLVTFEVETLLGKFTRLGALWRECVVDLNFAAAARLALQGKPQPQRLADVLLPADMISFLEMGADALKEAGLALAFLDSEIQARGTPVGPRGERIVHVQGTTRLLAPIQPRSLRDFFAYEDHALHTAQRSGVPLSEKWYDHPVYFKGNPREIYGPEAEVPWPSYTRRLDFELEVAAVVGKEGRNLPPAQAASCIAGFTILNDFSARDIQKSEMACGVGPAKGKDFAYALGPCLVTRDEIDLDADLFMEAWVNGQKWSQGRTRDRYWSWGLMLSHVSQEETVYPGDVLGSGTFYQGCGLDLGRWLNPGDEVELRVQGIGSLRNKVAAPKAQIRLKYPRG
ncbi:MAG TPA: 2-hydroxyhepta-2,4-diene-1,7-dioate isomerase [Elusimicrobia bacterium]|nr:2-hydroxyhepta-2,4-diene-1,7-dioate isomerase [Elusimicrobiota bacterium]HBT62589.1 2-hydroxyhepta-2,4-diene-1,7-dioate isomerase [Elusimicrobiota bacterium]